MPDDLLDGLNPAQLEAVTHTDGPLLVVAGAGSGKTRVLTHRIAHLIDEHGVSPFEILAITFTNKAADEMQRAGRPRSSARWPRRCGCPRSTRRACASCGATPSASATRRRSRSTTRPTPSASPATSSATSASTPSGSRPASVHATISRGQERRLVGPDEYARPGRRSSSSARSPTSIAEYQARLLKAGAMDFDDLLAQHRRAVPHAPRRARALPATASSTSSSTSTRTPTGPRTSSCCCSATEHRNVCVVGDTDQSIYRFRGADIRNILEFEEAFPDVTVVVLEQNYRSTQTILDAANAVIANNLGRKPKDLWTDAGPGRPDRALPRRGRGRRGPVGRPPDHATCTTAATRAGATWPSSTAPTPRAACIEEELMRVGHAVQGGRRHPLLRPAGDQGRAGLPEGRGEPGRRGQRQAGAQRAQARHRRHDASAGSTPTPAATASPSSTRCAAADEAGVTGRAARGIEAFVDLLDDLAAAAPATARPRVLEAVLRAHAATWPSSRPSTPSRPRAASRTWPSWSASARDFERDRRVPRAGRPGGRHRRARRRRLVRCADDPALGQGPRVPGRVPVGLEDGVFPHMRALDRARRAGGGAAALPTSASPGPASGCTCPTPGAAPSSAPPSTTRPAGSSTRSPPGSWRSPRPAGHRAGPASARSGGWESTSWSPLGPRTARWSGPLRPARALAVRGPAWASGSATTCATPSGARAW